jgi:hypothetical protein
MLSGVGRPEKGPPEFPVLLGLPELLEPVVVVPPEPELVEFCLRVQEHSRPLEQKEKDEFVQRDPLTH